MFNYNKKMIKELNNNIYKLNIALDEFYILGNKREIIKRNLLAGIFRGDGIGIGITFISGIIIWILQKIVMLNLPIISQYIADIIEIVQNNLQISR